MYIIHLLFGLQNTTSYHRAFKLSLAIITVRTTRGEKKKYFDLLYSILYFRLEEQQQKLNYIENLIKKEFLSFKNNLTSIPLCAAWYSKMLLNKKSTHLNCIIRWNGPHQTFGEGIFRIFEVENVASGN